MLPASVAHILRAALDPVSNLDRPTAVDRRAEESERVHDVERRQRLPVLVLDELDGAPQDLAETR